MIELFAYLFVITTSLLFLYWRIPVWRRWFKYGKWTPKEVCNRLDAQEKERDK